MLTASPYAVGLKEEWDSFVRTTKNGCFLFFRDYIEYHANRFPDYSLLFHRDDELIAVLPASRRDDEVSSHGGLTFGGVLSDERMTTSGMLEVFDTLLSQLRSDGIRRFVYKAPPSFYHVLPADEDLYALTRNGAHLFRRDVGSILRPRAHPEFRHGRRHSLKSALKAGLVFRETADFAGYWQLLEQTLRSRHAAAPTHSLAEIEALRSRFPRNIRLFGAFKGDELLAGTVVYENANVAHTQYIACSPAGREVGALDLILSELITRVFVDKEWFSFGISTEEGGAVLNKGLIEHKEGFGARACVQDFYEIGL